MNKIVLKKGIALSVATVLVVGSMLPSVVYAAESINTEEKCSITFQVPIGSDGSSSFEDLQNMSSIPVAVYQIATVDVGGQFTATDDFSSVDMAGVAAATTADEMMTYVDQAFAIAKETEPTATNELVEDSYADQITDLDTGLYLVVPGEIGLTDEYDYGIVLTDLNEYDFSPYIMSLPYNPYFQTDGASDAWDYNPTTSLKAEPHERLGDIVLTKTLTIFDLMRNTGTFSFDVEAVKGGETVFKTTVGTTFTGSGSNKIVIEEVPLGSTVTITETYSGIYETETNIPAFEMTADGQGYEVVVEKQISNVPGKRLVQGNGSVNHYTYDEESGTWSVEKNYMGDEGALPQ